MQQLLLPFDDLEPQCVYTLRFGRFYTDNSQPNFGNPD